MTPLWAKQNFLVARMFGAETVSGFVYAGLGMHKAIRGSPKGRRPPTWMLTHLGSGHVIARISAHMAEAFEIATQIAEVGDWDWDGLEGYRNKDPEIKYKLLAMTLPKSCQIRLSGAGNEDAAREIAMARA